MRWLNKHKGDLLLILIFLVGLGLLGYPSVADAWNKIHQSRAIDTYTVQIANLDEEVYNQMLEAAQQYNEQLIKRGTCWVLSEQEKEAYNSILNVTDSGIMGYIEIERINCHLAIYHGTSDKVLQSGVGHLEASSLPVGGESTHTILSGHRGLPSAKLFTDLDQLELGDTFIITTLSETLTYEIDQILIVEPEDLSNLEIIPGEDLCTLITCTPYGVNTHRLLVRGHRIENVKKSQNLHITADAYQVEPIFVAPVIAVFILLMILMIVLIDPRFRDR